MELREKIEKEICVNKNGIDVVKDSEKEDVLAIINKFIETVSSYSDKIDEDILIKKIASLDIIRLNEDKTLKNILNDIDSSRNFYKKIDGKKYNGIILYKEADKEGIHAFFHLLMHQIVENEVREDGVYHRDFIDMKLDNKLKEGFIESFSEVIWNRAFPTTTCPGMEDDKYFAESQVMGIMIDIMGKKNTFDALVTEPEQVIEKLENAEYNGESLSDYLETQLNLVSFTSKNRISQSSRIINCVEAISDCSDELVIRKEKVKVKR